MINNTYDYRDWKDISEKMADLYEENCFHDPALDERFVDVDTLSQIGKLFETVPDQYMVEALTQFRQLLQDRGLDKVNVSQFQETVH